MITSSSLINALRASVIGLRRAGCSTRDRLMQGSNTHWIGRPAAAPAVAFRRNIDLPPAHTADESHSREEDSSQTEPLPRSVSDAGAPWDPGPDSCHAEALCRDAADGRER